MPVMDIQRMKRNKTKNICNYCGGKMVIEFIGSYGAVYPMKKNGEPGKRRIRRFMYEESGGDFLVYCSACGKQRET